MIERRAIVVTGVVQGVGFRPFVFANATRLGLVGFVRNQPSGVVIEVEGGAPALDELVRQIRVAPPPLARVETVSAAPVPLRGEALFSIATSEDAASESFVIGADTATCADCVRELLDPADRRYRYPLLNCTNCGPRLTLVTGAPYDRERTTMAAYPLCAACKAEYDDPRDRRFHAQPVACPACGPRLRALDASGGEIDGDPIDRALQAIERGEIVAVKGIGGYHLACDAESERAVAELRRRKRRDAKPFAVMGRDLEALARLGVIGEAEERALLSSQRPVVLVARREAAPVAASVAPGMSTLGLMLPYTPVHHLLFASLGQRILVMTSANLTDEPIAFDDDDARARLGKIADLFLVHERRIATACDDSVVRVLDGRPTPLRRARGYAPEPIDLGGELALPTLAVGGHLKSTFALGASRRAWVSHHLGDLDDYAAYEAYVAAILHYQDLFRVSPARLVHDLHPDYASTRYALERAARSGLETLAVQHHHAHVAAALAEHRLARAIGVAFDGTGFGTDGAIWGGEIFVGDRLHLRRAAHLAYVRAPGGDAAIREPWRMALAHLTHAGEVSAPLAARVGARAIETVRLVLERGINAPFTSSMGRLFDAVACLVLGHDRAAFEGEAAMRLEALAAAAPREARAYPFDVTVDAAGAMLLDPRPLLHAVVRDLGARRAPEVVAKRFHATVAEMVAHVAKELRTATGIADVVLTGGCFVNAVLTSLTASRLREAGLTPRVSRLVPPNDGGISFGQLAVAAAHDAAHRNVEVA